jgi:NADPH:quinone reductase-like Zn-dependent oxidoreductase
MKAALLESFGLGGLRLVERPDPKPGPGQVLLRLSRVSLNYRDLMMVEGRYNPRQPLPLIVASDGVGEVIAVGNGVSEVKPGERVCPIFAQRWLSGSPTRAIARSTLGGPLDGTLAEYMIADARGVVRPPAHLTDAEAACLPCAAVTAYNAISLQTKTEPGSTLVTLGTGGVSLFALAFAKLAGARVVLTSKSNEKLARARALGADETINYSETPEWGKRVRELTDGEGAEHIIEVGGAGTLEQSLRAVRPGGRISLIGVLSGGKSELDVRPILMQNITVQGVYVGSRDSFEAMNRAIEAAQLRPVIDREFPLDDVKAAFEHLASGQHFGKIVVRIR